MFAAFTAPIFAAPPVSLAQNASEKEYTLLAPLPCIPTAELPCGGSGGAVIKPSVTFRTYVQYAMNIMIALAAVAAVVMIVWGGLLYMTTTAVSGKTEGLDKVKNALYGLLLVLASYLILKTIDPRLVQIPSTIVPKIRLQNVDIANTSLHFLTQLEREANYYKVETDSLTAARETAKRDLAQKQQELEELSKRYDAVLNDSSAGQKELDELELEWQKLNNEISAIVAEQTYSTYKAAVTGTMNSLTQSHDEKGNIDLSDNTPTAIQDRIYKLDQAYEKGTAALNNTTASQAEITSFKDEYNYVRGELAILKFVNTPTVQKTRSKLNSLKAQIDINIQAIADAQRKELLKQKFETVKYAYENPQNIYMQFE